MRMSFDELRATMAPAQGLGAGQAAALRSPAEVPENPHELDVLFCGPGADAASASTRGAVGTLKRERAIDACKGKRDIFAFDPLDEALAAGKRVVLVAPRGSGGTLPSAQAYLATSLSRWLHEEKTDGEGRPYGEVKDEDPTLKKKFTRAQVLAVQRFGAGSS